MAKHTKPPRPKRTTPRSSEVRFVIPRDDLVRLLFRQGWLPFPSLDEAMKKATGRVLSSVLKTYQQFHGLNTDGWAGPVTERSFTQGRFCRHPDVMPIQQSLCKWLDEPAQLTWCLTGNPPALDQQATKDAFAWVFATWQKVCGVRFTFTTEPGKANILIGFAPIDGPGATLAYSELPCAQQRQCQQTFDNSEPWAFGPTVDRFKLDIGATAAHEVGHVLGLPHLPSGCLLQPIYQEGLREPQTGDIQEVQARYGPPRADEPTPAPSGGRSRVVLEIEGKIVGGELAGFRLVPV